jgi:hypothetical protein
MKIARQRSKIAWKTNGKLWGKWRLKCYSKRHYDYEVAVVSSSAFLEISRKNAAALWLQFPNFVQKIRVIVAFQNNISVSRIHENFIPMILFLNISIHKMTFGGILKDNSLISRTMDAQWSLFSFKFRTFGLGQTNWADKLGIFSAKLSAPILVQWGPCPCFSLFNHYFYKKLSLYIHILNIYLELGFAPKK